MTVSATPTIPLPSPTTTPTTIGPQVITFRDAIEHLADYAGGLGAETEVRRARACVIQAYRDVCTADDWKCYRGTGRIELKAPYTTGTVTYVSATRYLTISGGTWPSWAASGVIEISGVSPAKYKVSSRLSDSVLLLDASFCPQSDITDATGFTIFRSIYPLPAGTIKFSPPVTELRVWPLWQATIEEWMRNERLWNRQGTPYSYTLLVDPSDPNRRELGFWGHPSSDATLDFVYVRSARGLVLDGYTRYSSQNGTDKLSGTVAANATTVTLSSPDAAQPMVGAVLRLAFDDATTPPGGLEEQNPYLSQHFIQSVNTSTGVLTLASEVPYATTSTQFTISDPIDLPDHIVPAFERRCEFYWALKMQPQLVKQAAAAYQEAYINAKAQDVVTPPIGSVLHWDGARGMTPPYPYTISLDGHRVV